MGVWNVEGGVGAYVSGLFLSAVDDKRYKNQIFVSYSFHAVRVAVFTEGRVTRADFDCFSVLRVAAAAGEDVVAFGIICVAMDAERAADRNRDAGKEAAFVFHFFFGKKRQNDDVTFAAACVLADNGVEIFHHVSPFLDENKKYFLYYIRA